MNAKNFNSTAAAVRPINDHHWNFSTCPENQLRWCCQYEHCRSNQVVVDAVRHHRKYGTWPEDWAGRFADQACQNLAQQMFQEFPEFPEKPFLDINANLRAGKCAKLEEARQCLTVRLASSIVERGGEDKVVIVSRCASSEDLNRLFRSLDRKKLRGRQNFGSRLRVLGGSRLYTHFGDWNIALSYAEKREHEGGLKPLYPDQGGWSRAKADARLNVCGVLKELW